jgi:hypothetical protein
VTVLDDQLLDDSNDLHEDTEETVGPEESTTPRGDPDRPCQRPGCPNHLPVGAISTQRYCPEHQPKKKKNLGGPAGPLPPRVTINVPKTGASKTDSDAAKVEAGALSMFSLAATGLALVDPVCAKAVLDAVPAIARQLGELSKFQPVLKKIFTPGEGTGEALAHHNLLKPETVERLSAIFTAIPAADAGA